MSYNDYPEKASENAQMALDARDDTGNPRSCGTRTGWTRANQLANRENISLETVKRMASFRRHEDNKEMSDEEGRRDCGWMMWKAWGGDEGIAWAERKVEQVEKQGSKKQRSHCNSCMKLTIQENLEPGRVKKEGKTFKGLALPFNKESRNGVTYDTESIEKKADTMIGRPVLWNHDDTIPSIGKVTDVEVTSEGLNYELELDEEDELASSISKKLEKGYISHVSIQAFVEEQSVEAYMENPESSKGVVVKEFLELTVCNIPGFPETTAQKNTAVLTEKMLNPEKENQEISEDEDPCWDGYKMIGVKTQDGEQVPRCVPEELLNKDNELRNMSKKKDENMKEQKKSIQENIERLEEKIAKIESTPQNLVISEAMSEEQASVVVEMITERVTEHLGMAMEEIRQGLLDLDQEDGEDEEEMYKDKEEKDVDTKEGEEAFNPDSLKKPEKQQKSVGEAWREALNEISKVNK